MGALLFARLCRSLRGVPAFLLLLGSGLLFLALLLGALAALAWDDLAQLAAPKLVLTLDPALGEARLDALYLEVRGWEGVRALQFRLDASTFEAAGSLDVPAGPGLQLWLAPEADLQAMLTRTRALTGVQGVYLSRVEPSSHLLNRSQQLKPALFAAFVVAWLAALLALRAGVGRLAGQWRGELELLSLSGVSRRNVMPAFALVGLVAAALSALLAAVGLYGALLWAQSQRELVQSVLPLMLDAERMVGLALGALILGLLSGVVAGLWGARAVRRA